VTTGGSGVAAYLNGLGGAELAAALRLCCASEPWVAGMARRAPFEDDADVHAAATETWWALEPAGWREAFAAHPRIGAREIEHRRARSEQSGVDGASGEVLAALARGNVAYEERFGFIFLICASGLGAGEMLAALETRLENAPGIELRVAAEEQAKITRLRLDRLGGGA